MAKVTKKPGIADPAIDQIFDEFLAEQRKRLKPRTMSGYEDTIHLLKDYMNGYAYQGLSKAESALFAYSGIAFPVIPE